MSPIVMYRRPAPFQSDPSIIDGKAFDLDGTEYLLNSSDVALGISNTWSIQALFKPDISVESSVEFLFEMGPPGLTDDRIQLLFIGVLPDDPVQISISDTTSLIKSYQYNNTYSGNVKVNYVTTWDGTNLLFYVDGVEKVADTKPTDSTGTMTDSNRRIAVAAATNGTLTVEGIYHSFAVWDVVLDQGAITELENSGVPENLDHTVNGTNYTDAANLVHYYRLGLDSGDIGKDSGTGTAIDIGDAAVGITAADIVDY